MLQFAYPGRGELCKYVPIIREAHKIVRKVLHIVFLLDLFYSDVKIIVNVEIILHRSS